MGGVGVLVMCPCVRDATVRSVIPRPTPVTAPGGSGDRDPELSSSCAAHLRASRGGNSPTSMAALIFFLVSADALAPPQIRRVSGREANSFCYPVAELCAEAICDASERTEKAILSSALERDLRQRLLGKRSSALWIAQDADNNVVGSCAVEVGNLSPDALDEQRLSRQGSLATNMAARPLLSSLAVDPKFRRRGLAKKLCREAEDLAKDWGYDEVLLKVERDNGKARGLYNKIGYRAVAIDKDAERPVAGPGGVKYVPTVQVAMRKSLRYPPVDTVVSAVGLLAAASYSYMQHSSELAEAAGLVKSGQLEPAAQLLLQLVQSDLSPLLERLEPLVQSGFPFR